MVLYEYVKIQVTKTKRHLTISIHIQLAAKVCRVPEISKRYLIHDLFCIIRKRLHFVLSVRMHNFFLI